MERYEVNKKIDQFTYSIESLTKAIQPENLEETFQKLNVLMQEQDFWSNPEKARKISKQATMIRHKIDHLMKLKRAVEGIIEWFDISEEGSEEWKILESDILTAQREIENFELEILLDEPYDDHDAILEIHAGAGGTEAQDWGEMLFRMYQRYAQQQGFKFEVLDYLQGEEAGLKSVTFIIRGDFAYGYLKSERGVHRLVRISPFDSNQRRHTSFASVDIMPEFDDDIQIDIKDEDIKIDVYRSSGAGGQSVNTTDSAVRITHSKTGIVVTCQNERSQIKNRETALKLLKAKLLQLEIQKQEDKVKNLKGEQKDIAWGSQIRSYVFHPYQMVKDHRTNFETSQVTQVMDGDLSPFMDAYLRKKGGSHHENQ